MKTLLLIRHAKSSWADFNQPDIERPLNDRGKKEAPEMANRIKEKGLKPDLLVSSTAKRAQKTAKLFAEIFNIDKEQIFITEALYEAAVADYERVVGSLPDKKHTIFLFAHNPTITSFANNLTNVRIDDMPTSSVFAINANCENWNQFMSAEKRFLFFDYPKNPMNK